MKNKTNNNAKGVFTPKDVFIPAVLGIVLIIVLVSGCIEESPETPEEFCIKKGTGEQLSLTEAREIATASECGKQGALKDTYICNEDTGTWWIDMDIQKEGCNPACVINVVTKQAEINWRCTGLLSPEKACTDSGGTVRTSMCCKSTGDFPNLCAVGACGCAPEHSHEVKICDCGEGKCFDGNMCVPVGLH